MESLQPLLNQHRSSSQIQNSNKKSSKKIFHFHHYRWLICIFLPCIVLFLLYNSQVDNLHFHVMVYGELDEVPLHGLKSGFLVNTPGCRIPNLDPFDPIVREFIKKPEKIKCEKNLPLVVEANQTSLFILSSSFSALNISKREELDCCYQPLWRSTQYKNITKVDNKVTFANTCISFTNEVNVKEEFVKIVCKVNGTVVHKNYHAFVPLKTDVEKRCQEALKNLSNPTEKKLSVLVVGMDSVSRMNFHRQMPITSMFLRQIDAIELLGYNKIDDNTFLNLVAVLSGFTEKEIANSCWSKKTYFDDCHWVWENYSATGYRTAFGEDASSMGLFTYLKRGFKNQPTDYYLRPFMYSSEDDIGYNEDPYCKVCLGSEMTIVVLLRYITNYAQTMASKDSFAFFWGSSLSHDYLNYPSLGDDLYANFFSNLIDSGSLNNTLLIFMSDHGIRWGGIRETYQGRLEERLPFVFFVFPTWFKEKYPSAVANLRKNAYRLSSPFDLYSTLLDIVDLKQLEQNSIKERSEKLAKTESKPRSISLFLPVHTARTCEEAGIEKHWCTCQASKVLSNSDSIVKRMSAITVDHINSLLHPYGLCAQLELEEVKSASVEFPRGDLSHKTKDTGLKDYVVVVQTTPGRALFEATVRHHLKSNNVTVIGTVSRINAYGNQSSCITDYHMKLYCYCDYSLQKRKHDG